MASNMLYYHKIDKNIRKLVQKFEENVLFVSQYRDNEKDKATVMLAIHHDGETIKDEEAYLGTRRLLEALKYRLEKDTNLRLEFELKRKASK